MKELQWYDTHVFLYPYIAAGVIGDEKKLHRLADLMSDFLFNKIANWLEYQPRTKLVLLKKKHRSIEYVNMGYELAMAIKDDLHKPSLPMKAEQCARSIINAAKKHDELIGEYVAIENWAILMEPELKLNITSFLSGISQNTALILYIDEAKNEDSYNGLRLDSIEYYQPC